MEILNIKSNVIKKRDLKKHFDSLIVPGEETSQDVFEFLGVDRII